MNRTSERINYCILHKNDREMSDLLHSGLDPNYESGWPIRLAARHGVYTIVKLLIQYGANPHLLSESGASTLQLAVFSSQHWDTNNWNFLLSYCDSSQLADGAAVAIIFQNTAAFKKILETGRCNTHIPTTLTGKTVENLAKGYKLHHLLNYNSDRIDDQLTEISSPRVSRQNRPITRNTLTSQHTHRNLSPSVASFFNQTANQSALSPSRSTIMSGYSPTNN